jgi:hypothetical protein
VHRGRVELGAQLHLGLEAVQGRLHHRVGTGQTRLAALVRGREAGVQGDERGADARRGVHQHGEVEPGREGGRHAVAVAHPQRREPARRDVRLGVELRVGERARGGLHRRMPWARARR